jgi:integrase
MRMMEKRKSEQNMMLSAFFEREYLPHRLAGASPNTIRLHENALYHFYRFLKRPAQLRDFNNNTVTALLAWMATQTDRRKELLSPVTCNKVLKQLLALWRYAALKHLVADLPDVRNLREPKRVPTAWTVEQMGLILDACREAHGFISGIKARLYWTALVLTLYDTGLRSGAAWAIRRANVDQMARLIYVPAETQKNRQDQLVRISPQTVEAIQKIWLPERELLFPWDLNPLYKWNKFRRILKPTGLPTTRRDLFQRIRRTTATLCKAGGADATEQLGHSSDAITRRHYLAPNISRQAADVLPRPTAEALNEERVQQSPFVFNTFVSTF